ncbi:MAG TPA: hypothetical protein VHG08_18340 [Longimicrobium sp.]|nr:hypothetical protein [Longimicrobium sp.]
MKKLELNVDALQVESFDTAPAEMEGRGTVRGHDATEYGGASCAPNCSDTNFTDWASCQGCTADPYTCPSRRPGEYTCQTM